MRKILVLIFLLSPFISRAQVACPFGKINDSYPGDCALFVDNNGNTVCDLSEVDKEDKADEEEKCIENNLKIGKGISDQLITGKNLKTKTIKEVADILNIDVKEFSIAIASFLSAPVMEIQTFQELHDAFLLKPSQVKEIAEQVYETEAPKHNIASQLVETSKPAATKKPRYALFPIIGLFVFLFLTTHFLSKKRKISVLTHKRIWNIILLASFLAVGLSGILLILRINYGIVIFLPFNILYWHVEIGIVMALGAFFHIAWHWRYFTSIFKKKK